MNDEHRTFMHELRAASWARGARWEGRRGKDAETKVADRPCPVIRVTGKQPFKEEKTIAVKQAARRRR
jgi:hypothetical protein